MATKAYIVYMDNDGSYHYRYSDQEGYVMGLGLALHTTFNDPRHVKKLFDMERNLFSVGMNVKDFSDYAVKNMNFLENHHVEVINKTMAIASYDKLLFPCKVDDFDELQKVCNTDHCYFYSMKDNEWTLIYQKEHFLSLQEALQIQQSINFYKNNIERNNALTHSDAIFKLGNKIIDNALQHYDASTHQLSLNALWKQDNIDYLYFIKNYVLARDLQQDLPNTSNKTSQRKI